MIWYERLSKWNSTKVNEPILSLKGTNTVAPDLGWDRHSLPDIDVIISRPKGPEKGLGDKKKNGAGFLQLAKIKIKCSHTLKNRLFCWSCFDFCLFIDWLICCCCCCCCFSILRNCFTETVYGRRHHPVLAEVNSGYKNADSVPGCVKSKSFMTTHLPTCPSWYKNISHRKTLTL